MDIVEMNKSNNDSKTTLFRGRATVTVLMMNKGPKCDFDVNGQTWRHSH